MHNKDRDRYRKLMYPLLDQEKLDTVLQEYGNVIDANAVTLRQVELSLYFLLSCTPRRTFDRKRSSYGLKATAERVARAIPNVGNAYISNSAFIAAAILCGFKIDPIEGTPNVHLNIRARARDTQRLEELLYNEYTCEL